MIGAIIGDIVGSRFEFHNHRSTEFDFFHADCNFTDDTVMTVAVADAILSDRPFGEVMYEYGHKHPKRGYGGRFYKWVLSRNPKPYNSFGNGSAMRVSPCAFLANGNREQALTWATASAVCTHNHPEGVKGAMVITDCILMAQKGYSKDEIKVELKKGTLTVSAEKNSSKEEKDENNKYVRRERFVGRSQRSFYVGEETATLSPISPAVSPRHITEYLIGCETRQWPCCRRRCSRY